MTWRNPIAWLGLAALAVPILVHLLSRRTIRRIRFPTLRFIDPTRLTPTRRRRLTDIPLLLVRMATIAVAVAALAQPWFITGSRERQAGDRIVRAIVVDTSASMTRSDASAPAALDAARAQAATLADQADLARIVEGDEPDLALEGAAAWLMSRSGRRELVVISDFQRGAVRDETVRELTESIGLRFIRAGAETPAPDTTVLEYELGGSAIAASVTPLPDLTEITWRQRSGAPSSDGTIVLAGDEPSARAITAAARGLNRLGAPAEGPVAVVLPGHADSAALARAARLVDRPWMFDVVEALRRDEAVAHAAATARAATTYDAEGLTPLVRAEAAGDVLAAAGVVNVDGLDRLAIFLTTGAESPFTAAVLAGLPAATGPDTPADLGELEPARMADATLRSWEREPTAAPSTGPETSAGSDGRWLWLAALVLLGVETWLRRSPPAPAVAAKEVPRARVA